MLFPGLLLAVSRPAVADPDLEQFKAQHRCAIVERLDQIHANRSRKWRDGRNRFIIVAPIVSPQTFVQCIFSHADTRLHCEVASGYYLTKPGEPRRRLVTGEALSALAELGFSNDDSRGNYKLDLSIAGQGDFARVSDVMLTALYRGFAVGPAALLEFKAPLVKDRQSINSRCRTIS